MRIYRGGEAAEVLRVSPNRVYELIDLGLLKAYREGNNWCILDKHLEEYAEKRAETETKRRMKCQNEQNQ